MKFNQIAQALAPRIRQNELALAVDVVPRTVRNWKRRSKPGHFPKLGRPAHDERAHRQAFWRVGREYLRQGRCGWRPIAAALGGTGQDRVPVRLIQHYVKMFKAREKKHDHVRILRHQVRVEVHAKNAIWVQDSTQVGRTENGNKVESQVIKDRASLATLGLSTGAPAHATDVIELLDQLKQARGLPLVLASDNGSAFVAAEVEEYLKREQVIHLRSLPRTPEHNGSAEIGIKELKITAKLCKSALTTYQAAHAGLVRAADILNQNRIRMSKDLKTGAQLDETLTVSYHLVERARFYDECSKRIQQSQRDSVGAREKRMAEREAIYSTLEQFGLVSRTRGDS